MPSRIPEAIAFEVMIKAKLRPVGTYRNASSPWECICETCGELVTPSLLSIKSGQGGCAYCAGKKVNPDSAKTLMIRNGYEPLVDYPGSKVPWKSLHKKCGEIVYPKYNKIQQSGFSACNKCSKRHVNPLEAEQLMIAAGVIPQEPYPGKDKKWNCLCLKCGQIVQSHYSNVRDGGGGCRSCARRATSSKRRYSQDFVIAEFWKVNLIPLEPYVNTDAPLPSKCQVCGNIPSPTFTAIRAGVGCRYCSEKLTSPEKAIKLARKAGLEPLEPFVSGQVPWKCRHIECGSEITPLFGTILKGNSGCVKCNSRNAADKYRFSEVMAAEIMLAAQMQPLEPYKNALAKWKCKCLKCGSTITPKLNNVRSGSGCINCAEVGFQPNKEAYLYLLFHPELSAYKIGIGGSTNKNDRIKDHQKYGWLVFKRKDFKIGLRAYEVEQDVLSWLRGDLGLTPYLSIDQMPQGGHTETVDASEIDLSTIWAKVEEFSKAEMIQIENHSNA